MKKYTFTKLAIALAIGLSTVASSEAVFINGVINFSGGASTAPSTPAAATTITIVAPVTVAATKTGDYAAIATGTVAAFPASLVVPAVPGTGALSVNPYWTIVIGMTTYEFEITSLTNNSSTATTNRVLSGTGIAKITGFDDTPGTWGITLQGVSGDNVNLSFSTTTDAVGRVPEGGSTLAMLGLTVLGVGMAGRMRKARKISA